MKKLQNRESTSPNGWIPPNIKNVMSTIAMMMLGKFMARNHLGYWSMGKDWANVIYCGSFPRSILRNLRQNGVPIPNPYSLLP